MRQAWESSGKKVPAVLKNTKKKFAVKMSSAKFKSQFWPVFHTLDKSAPELLLTACASDLLSPEGSCPWREKYVQSKDRDDHDWALNSRFWYLESTGC